MEKNKNNRSLFLYTSLIFLVALIMIVLSFFGQSHLDGIRATEQQAKTITEKAAQLSDINYELTLENQELKDKLLAAETALEEQKAILDTLYVSDINLKNTVKAYRLCRQKKKSEAGEIISLVNPELLAPEEKALYDYVIDYIG